MVSKIDEKSPLKYLLVRSARCLDPTEMVKDKEKCKERLSKGNFVDVRQRVLHLNFHLTSVHLVTWRKAATNSLLWQGRARSRCHQACAQDREKHLLVFEGDLGVLPGVWHENAVFVEGGEGYYRPCG